MEKIKKVSLPDWINTEGVGKVARLLKVNISTVRHWRLGNHLPRSWQMRLIRELSKGACDYEQMIDGKLFMSKEQR